MSYKTCNRCGKEKPATTEYFRKAKANKDGLVGQCRDCIKEYEKQYRKKNKENIQQYKKQWNQENKEYIKEYNEEYYKQYYEENKECYKQHRKENKEYYREYNKQYRQENKEYIKEYNKEYYKQHHEENKEYSRQHRKENKEYYREYNKQYRQENKEYNKQYRQENIDRFRQYNQKRRTIKKRLPHTLTLDQWEKIKVDFNSKCAYCGMTEEEHRKRFNEQLHQEHFIPLSEGGEYTHNNIIPACRSCNCSKRNADFFEWYPTYEYYSIRREQKILDYLDYTGQKAQQLTLI